MFPFRLDIDFHRAPLTRTGPFGGISTDANSADKFSTTSLQGFPAGQPGITVEVRIRPSHPLAASLVSGLLDSVLTPGSGEGGESVVDAAQVCGHYKPTRKSPSLLPPPAVGHTVDINGRTIAVRVELNGSSVPLFEVFVCCLESGVI
nr:unnamed protein product [Spirometra erinaceieuropaei]